MPTPINMTPLAFLDLLNAGLDLQGFIEYRYLPSRERHWASYGPQQKEPFTLDLSPEGQNLYFGISLRKTKGKGGTSDVHLTRLLWVDIDLKGTRWVHGDMHPDQWTPQDIRAAAEALYQHVMNMCKVAGLHPRAIIYTGHGLQLYFARTCTTTYEDTVRFNKALIAFFEGDNLHDVARIFRLPGSKNWKNPQRPLDVEIWHTQPHATISETQLRELSEMAQEETKTPEPQNTRLPLQAPTPAATQQKVSVVEAFNARYSIHDILQRYGYKRESSTRYTRPGEGATPGGVHLWANGRGVMCSYHHSSNDPIPNRDHLHEPFDVYCWMEHNGNWKQAAKAAARELGISYQTTEKKPKPEPIPLAVKAEIEASNPLEQIDPDAKLSLTEYRDIFLQWCTLKDLRFKYHQKRRSWYQYRSGVYLEVLDEVMLQTVDKAFQSLGFSNLRTAFLKEILDKVSREFEIGAADEDLKPTELNVQNGILDLSQMVLRPHNPAFFSTIQSAAKYDPDLVAYDWLEFLDEAIPSAKDRLVLQMYSGLCLTAITEPQKALFLIGEGGTGKGTFVSVLETVLGGLATSSALENIKDGSFLVGNLVSKRMCIIDEIAKHIDWLPFKRVTGEASITVDVKNKTPYTERLTIKLIVLSNVLPLLGEDTTNTSLTRRILFVPFNVKPKVSDPGLKKRLTTPLELSGVLNWMIEGWKMLREQNLRFPDTESNAIQRQIKERSNHVITFVEECLAKGGEIAAGDLYEMYREWCQQSGHKSFAKNKFGGDMLPDAFKELGFEVGKKLTRSQNMWIGVHKPL